MSKSRFRRAFFLLLITCLWQVSQAQENQSKELHESNFSEGSISLGLAFPYAFSINALGINARMEYHIDEKISFGPEISYFNKDEAEIIDFDVVGQYIFETRYVAFYPFLGINYTIENEYLIGSERTEKEFGIVFGAGIHRNLNKFSVFLEYSRVELGIVDQFITTGLIYNF